MRIERYIATSTGSIGLLYLKLLLMRAVVRTTMTKFLF